MAWYWIVLITAVAIHLINTIILTKNEHAVIWCCFLAYYPLKVLLYPYTAHRRYKDCIGYYCNHNITYWQYMFGKRVIEVAIDDR